jgi:translation initiation factor IF-3
MDYSKFLYERTRREREARKAQKQTEIKEIRLRPKIADHDVQSRRTRPASFLPRAPKSGAGTFPRP